MARQLTALQDLIWSVAEYAPEEYRRLNTMFRSINRTDKNYMAEVQKIATKAIEIVNLVYV